MKNERPAFTLIELLVVIAIIALLMGILLPTLSRAREMAKRVVCSSQVKQVGVAITAYAADNENHMPIYNADAGKPPYLLVQSYVLYRSEAAYLDANGKPKPMKLALLYERGYIANPKVFYCPSNKNLLYRFESYNDPKPWGVLPQNYNTFDGAGHNQWIRMGYTYLPIDPRIPKNPAKQMPDETAKTIDAMDPYVPFMTDHIRHKYTISHQRKGTYAVNALFKDGRVTLCNDRRVFDNPVWDQMESGKVPELAANYTVFQLIGGRGIDAVK